MISKLYTTHGIKTIKAITTGNRIVQENDISWSKRILGNDALTHMKVNIIAQDFIPKAKPDKSPSRAGLDIVWNTLW